jgi:hypothetical protein
MPATGINPSSVDEERAPEEEYVPQNTGVKMRTPVPHARGPGDEYEEPMLVRGYFRML